MIKNLLALLCLALTVFGASPQHDYPDIQAILAHRAHAEWSFYGQEYDAASKYQEYLSRIMGTEQWLIVMEQNRVVIINRVNGHKLIINFYLEESY